VAACDWVAECFEVRSSNHCGDRGPLLIDSCSSWRDLSSAMASGNLDRRSADVIRSLKEEASC